MLHTGEMLEIDQSKNWPHTHAGSVLLHEPFRLSTLVHLLLLCSPINVLNYNFDLLPAQHPNLVFLLDNESHGS